MKWLFAVILSLLPVSAFATCGPDTAPMQAQNAGYTCETFRWGSGDTLSEIDTAQTSPAPCASPGLSPCGGVKWYYGTANNNGHVTVGSDFTVTGGSGKIVQNTGTPSGAFMLNTCASPPASTVYTGGTVFRNGWYLEFVGEWDATGHPGVQTGFYGLGYNSTVFPLPIQQNWEVDNPDAFANDQEVVIWPGPTGQSNGGGWTSHVLTHETGTTRFGAMITTSAFTWWINDVANGFVNFLGTPFDAAHLYPQAFCFGTETTTGFPFTLDSLKIWQVAPPMSGGGRRLKH